MKQFLESTGAEILQKGKEGSGLGITSDSRTMQGGELFFALKGPHFNGHIFCKEALTKKAWGIVIQEETLNDKIGPGWIFKVPDTLQALGSVARWWRSQFQVPVVAITGSNGKTTTKEMAAAILATEWKTLKTEGNFNNLIGLPLTLNRLNAAHQVAVLEMGMNDFGEIRRLTEIADPAVGAITNVAAAHLEKLETVEAVAKAKCELFETMSSEGVAIYNAEDRRLSENVKKFKGRKISFGMANKSQISFEHMESVGFDSMELKLAIEGKILKARVQASGVHNVMNAMTACAVALSLDLPLEKMQEGLENFRPLKMRFEQVQLGNGVRLINDAYNANPVSMEAALKTAGRAKRAGVFVAVLGDMKELGKKTAPLHEAIGKKAVEEGVGRFFLIGDYAKAVARGARAAGMDPKQITLGQNKEEIFETLEKELKTGDVVLVKASRSVGLESIAESLIERFGI